VSSRRGRTALLAGALLVPALGACGAGPESAATYPYSPSDGIQATIGPDLKILNALVIAPPEGSTTAVVSMSLSAPADGDALEQVTVSEATAEVQGSRDLRAGSLLRYGAPGSPDQILLQGFDAPAGGNVEMTLLFRDSGEVRLQPPVLAPTGYYEGLTAEELTAPGATPVPTPTVAPSPGETQEEPAVGREEGEATSPPTDAPEATSEASPEPTSGPTAGATPAG
jgi:hypothetical protein